MMINCDIEKCIKCAYFPYHTVEETRYNYYTDQYGVKHSDSKFLCLYDLHEIKRGHYCGRN